MEPNRRQNSLIELFKKMKSTDYQKLALLLSVIVILFGNNIIIRILQTNSHTANIKCNSQIIIESFLAGDKDDNALGHINGKVEELLELNMDYFSSKLGPAMEYRDSFYIWSCHNFKICIKPDENNVIEGMYIEVQNRNNLTLNSGFFKDNILIGETTVDEIFNIDGESHIIDLFLHRKEVMGIKDFAPRTKFYRIALKYEHAVPIRSYFPHVYFISEKGFDNYADLLKSKIIGFFVTRDDCQEYETNFCGNQYESISLEELKNERFRIDW